ncbi:hypothetical protein ACFOTA_17505 [Chitinophaga sp. GCM10012297]|uniref:Uncharacterized protein n=1 Tax=Chitinophaga chungangae TaxID=2821488 RepID=A0ABS3YH57_9BACT|nr:hypothetical protein [Chitinophaga chungangae]MBO9154019.1 hypothetical protein [Chitinophaga chungangae]
MENNRKISYNHVPARELMRLAIKFNVSFQKVKAAMYTLGHDLKDIEAWFQERKQKLEPEYSYFSRNRSSV